MDQSLFDTQPPTQIQQNTPSTQASVSESATGPSDNASPQEEVIDAVQQYNNGNPFPLIVALKHVDINSIRVKGDTPLLQSLVQMSLPLQKLLPSKHIQFSKDKHGRTPIFYAMEVMDIDAVYWCLQREEVFSIRDNEGITPAMVAIEKNFMPGLMLCMHFGHITDDLPHFCAKHDNLWALKFLKACKMDILKPLPKTPLEVAVENYSYECAYYLGRLNPDGFKVEELRNLNKSDTMMVILRDYQIYKKLRFFTELIEPSFVTESFMLLLIFLAINSFPKFVDVMILNVYMLCQFIVLIVFYSPFRAPAKRAVNILNLLKAPTFKEIPEDICPECVQVKPQSYQHCYQCGVCVKGFHFHKGVCVFHMNQGRWAVKEFMWLYLFYQIIDIYVDISVPLITCPNLKYFQIVELLYNNSTYLLNDLIFYLMSIYWLIKKALVAVQILYMMCTGYTYQQMMHNERYQYLYRPVKVGEHYVNKRIYVMDEGVWKGIKKAARNIVNFFV